MRSSGDYGDEMDREDPRLIESALSGRQTGEPALDRAARVVADLRRVLLEEPSPEAASRHLGAMLSTARSRGSSVLSRRRRRIASLPLAAVLVLGAGLSWGAVGISERPPGEVDGTQGAKPVADTLGQDGAHGEDVSAVAQDDSLQGCEKGQAVSEVASANGSRQGPAVDPCAKGEEGKARVEQASAKGKQTAEEAKAKAKDTAKASAGGGPPAGGGPSAAAGPPQHAGPPAGSPGSGNGGGTP
jgi:hypothetical protein